MNEFILRQALEHNDWSQLIDCLANHKTTLKELNNLYISTKINPLYKTPVKVNALMIAAMKGNLHVLNLLLEYGVVPTNENNAALLFAAYFDQHNAVKKLLEHGANVNFQSEMGHTALSYAIKHGHEPMVETLLQNGASIEYEAPSRIGNLGSLYYLLLAQLATTPKFCPLMQAKMKEQLSDVELVSNFEHEALYPESNTLRVCESFHKSMLTESAHRVAKFSNQQTALETAIITNHKPLLQTLLANNADVNALAHGVIPPVWLCILTRNTELLQVLLTAKPNLEFEDSWGLTALKLAILQNDLKMVEILLEAGALVDNSLSKSALATCIKFSGNEAILQALLSTNPNLNHTDANGYTPLMYAASHGNKEIVSKLLASGANVNYKNKEGASAFTQAAFHPSMNYSRSKTKDKYKEIVTVLINAGAIMDKGNHYSLQMCQEMKVHLKKIVQQRQRARLAQDYRDCLQKLENVNMIDIVTNPNVMMQDGKMESFLNGFQIWKKLHKTPQLQARICGFMGSPYPALAAQSVSHLSPPIADSNYNKLQVLMQKYNPEPSGTKIPKIETALRRAASAGNIADLMDIFEIATQININEPDPETQQTAMDLAIEYAEKTDDKLVLEFLQNKGASPRSTSPELLQKYSPTNNRLVFAN